MSEETQEISYDCNAEEEDNIQEDRVSFVESLAMLDKIKKCSFLEGESQMMLSTLTRKFEDLCIKNKKKVDKSILQLIHHTSYVSCISLEMKKKKNLYVMYRFFNQWKA